MNKTLMAVLLVLSFPSTSFSVQAQPGAPDTGRRIERMTEGLSDDQKGQIATIFNEQQTKLMALHQEERSQLQGILTQEQMTKSDEMHQQRRHNQSGNGTGGGNIAP